MVYIYMYIIYKMKNQTLPAAFIEVYVQNHLYHSPKPQLTVMPLISVQSSRHGIEKTITIHRGMNGCTALSQLR